MKGKPFQRKRCLVEIEVSVLNKFGGHYFMHKVLELEESLKIMQLELH